MLLTIIEFAGVTLGVKVLLGVILIYCLFPADGRCAACDGDTVPLQTRRGLRALGCACRLERRWCLHCGETMLARRVTPGGRRTADDAAPVRKAA